MATTVKEEMTVKVERSRSPDDEASAKRKRDDIPEDEKLEIDVSLPEPPSKKAKRAEKKKGKSKVAEPVSEATKELVKEYFNSDAAQALGPAVPNRSQYGIWIGNLPWVANRDSLRQFLKDEGDIDGKDIVRLHMPAPQNAEKFSDGRPKAQNKGFAYVDFTSSAVLDKALDLSERLMSGRRVLIKNAKSFEGRPARGSEKQATGASKKEATSRIFVGNLGFDITKEDLEEHFGQAGEVEDVHLATFQDSGKCKGFAWVRFKEVEAAEAAVRGYVYKKADDDDSESDDEEIIVDEDDKKRSKKASKSRRHKQHINRIQGRELRCEFAEDAQTRYKKRFGKEAPARENRESGNDAYARPPIPVRANAEPEESLESLAKEAAAARDMKGPKPAKKQDKEQRREQRKKRHDARTIAPGKALASAQRNTGAIVAGAGKKVTFD